MVIFLTIIHIIVCLSLIGIILLQAGKGQGLAGASFGGGNVQSALGTRAADVMTKVTTGVALLFLVTCISLSFIAAHNSRSLYRGAPGQAPLDLNEIQKALDDIKEDAAAESEGQVQSLQEKAAEQSKEAQERAQEALAS